MKPIETTPGWRFAHIGFEGDEVEVDGTQLWSIEWGKSQGKITVAHPQYPQQRHPVCIYRVGTGDREVVFAAGEFSNGVWGFFTPEPTEL